MLCVFRILTEYQYIPQPVLYSCFLLHRIFHTYYKYRCGRPPVFCCRGLLLQFQDPERIQTVHPSQEQRRASAILSSISLAPGIPLAISAA